MKNLWWKTFGGGDYHLIMLHGWGLSAKVWDQISVQLTPHFLLHLVDLPGFGRSIEYDDAMTLNEIIECVLKQAPNKAIWLGWSFGGLVASQIAIKNPERVRALITVASSPCFSARESWPGINQKIFSEFQHHIKENFQSTIERFLTLQTMLTDTAHRDARILKNIMLSLPTLKISVLNNGLEILKNTDLRKPLVRLKKPHLRIYGALDGLVPYKIVSILDSYWPNSKSLILKKAAHVPFISHPDKFCKLVINFSNYIKSIGLCSYF